MDIKLADLEQITDYFSDQYMVGSGGYGSVYWCVYNGQEIAVKKLHALQGLDDKHLESQLPNIIKVNHPNVVRLIAYCWETHKKYLEYNGELVFGRVMERALCFEYMEGGSLDKHIYDESCDLDWLTCYKIIKGTCEGLNHLHNSAERRNFHLGLKPSNILLDKNLTAKIGDLGLSRLIASTQTHKDEVRNGTHGYMPPEYIDSGHISNKFDVFSLGVIILKIMAGNKGYSRRYELPPKKFAELVINNWKERMQITSPYFLHVKNIRRAEACVNIALRCVDGDRFRRPSVKDIVNELEELESKISKQLPLRSYPESFGEHYRYAHARFEELFVE